MSMPKDVHIRDDADGGVELSSEFDEDAVRFCHEAVYDNARARIAELEARIKRLRECQSCPCGDIGYTVEPNPRTGEPEQVQCEFCYTDNSSRFQALEETPAQSLAAIKREAMEEMREACVTTTMETAGAKARIVAALKAMPLPTKGDEDEG